MQQVSNGVTTNISGDSSSFMYMTKATSTRQDGKIRKMGVDKRKEKLRKNEIRERSQGTGDQAKTRRFSQEKRPYIIHTNSPPANYQPIYS
jgi:hypothetical protein